jgi:hypothetical protein
MKVFPACYFARREAWGVYTTKTGISAYKNHPHAHRHPHKSLEEEEDDEDDKELKKHPTLAGIKISATLAG